MAWYIVQCTIEMEIEARDEQGAIDKADTIMEKRVVGQSFGNSRNDRGQVTRNYSIDTVTEDDDEPEDKQDDGQ